MSTTHELRWSDQENFTLGLISDTHYWPGGGVFYGGDGSLQLLGRSEQLLTTLTAQLAESDVDLIFHLGDVTCGGGTYLITEDEFLQAQQSMHAGLTGGKAPAFALPGNHDCPPGGGPWTDFERRWQLPTGMGRTIDTPFARLVLLNAQGHTAEQVEAARPGDPIYGWVSEAELARLETTLATAGDRPVILFVHQLLQPWQSERPFADYYSVANAEAVVNVLVKHGNVRAVFQGHAHRFDVQQSMLGNDPCWFMVCPAIIQYPVAWLALTLSAQQLRVQLRPLPLPDLRQQALASGEGQGWRAGSPAWHDFAIDL